MTRTHSLSVFALLLVLPIASRPQTAVGDSAGAAPAPGEAVEFFQAMADGQTEVKFLARNDREARILVTNKTDQPLNLRLPDAFAGIPALAQMRGGMGGMGGAGRGGGMGMGGGAQGMGGGMGGMGMGGGMMGGGMGMFSIPPEQTARLDVPVVCLDHGLRTPNSAMAYVMVPADHYVDRPAMIELLKAFGRGELNHGAAQAATWHLNNDLSWQELAAKRQGTRRSFQRPPYFSPQELQAALTYAVQAHQLAEANRELYEDNEHDYESGEWYPSDEPGDDTAVIATEAGDGSGLSGE